MSIANDRERIDRIIAISGVVGLFARFDDPCEDEVTLVCGSRVRGPYGPLASDMSEIETEILTWPGSRIIGFTEGGDPIVTRDGDRDRGVVVNVATGQLRERRTWSDNNGVWSLVPELRLVRS